MEPTSRVQHLGPHPGITHLALHAAVSGFSTLDSTLESRMLPQQASCQGAVRGAEVLSGGKEVVQAMQSGGGYCGLAMFCFFSCFLSYMYTDIYIYIYILFSVVTKVHI